jgi:hypothetical protein
MNSPNCVEIYKEISDKYWYEHEPDDYLELVDSLIEYSKESMEKDRENLANWNLR